MQANDSSAARSYTQPPVDVVKQSTKESTGKDFPWDKVDHHDMDPYTVLDSEQPKVQLVAEPVSPSYKLSKDLMTF